MDTVADLTMTGEAAEDYFGVSVGTAGDVNGDGFADMIVGAFNNDAGSLDAGRAYVYYGGPGVDATFDLTFTSEVAGERFGHSVGAAGDVNGDGYTDVIMGAWANGIGGTDAGRAYVSRAWLCKEKLTDDFNDNSIDTGKWSAVTASCAGLVAEQNQRMEFPAGAYLNTVTEFNPMISPVVITGRWTFQNAGDNVYILTRSDGVPNTGYFCETTNGLEALINNDFNLLAITERTSNTELIRTTIDINVGDVFEFEVIDDGLSMSLSVVEIGGDGSSASISALSNLNTGYNLITFHNRGLPGMISYLDDVSICTVDSIPPPCDGIVVESVEKCGVSGQVKVPLTVTNRTAVKADLIVNCSVDGVLEQVLQLFDLAPDESRSLGFVTTCALDQELDVVCDLVIVPTGQPDSVLFTCTSTSTINCFINCCEQLFLARSSTSGVGVPTYYDFAQISTIRGEGDQFYLRGSCSSSGEWVGDDEVHVEATSFAGHLGDQGSGFPVGVPIETVMNPVGALEVTDAIPWGENLTTFRLQDTQGSIFGNTDIFLIKTSTGAITGVVPDLTPVASRLVIRASPNPTAAAVNISVEGAGAQGVHLSILDIQGRLVREFGQVHDHVRWDGVGRMGTRVASGMYFVVAKAAGQLATRKLFLLR